MRGRGLAYRTRMQLSRFYRKRSIDGTFKNFPCPKCGWVPLLTAKIKDENAFTFKCRRCELHEEETVSLNETIVDAYCQMTDRMQKAISSRQVVTVEDKKQYVTV
jgi:transcription elongation factor Elf1